MKRISFKDSGGLNLTQAVLSGRKTMTRRIAYKGEIKNLNTGFFTEGKDKGRLALCESNFVVTKSQYGKGEVVAIQQAYRDVVRQDGEFPHLYFSNKAGWTNKMFVAASMMPHHIRITDVRVERLQLIPYEDCLREGVIRDVKLRLPRYYARAVEIASTNGYTTARIAFVALIDKVSGRGTWNSNPLVWAYSFELVD